MEKYLLITEDLALISRIVDGILFSLKKVICALSFHGKRNLKRHTKHIN